MKYHIECQHGTLEKPIPDYYPLSKRDVKHLLTIASESRDGQEIASIQVRLGQGIPGMQCPREIDGPVAEKLNQLDKYFVGHFRIASIEEMVDGLWPLMQE